MNPKDVILYLATDFLRLVEYQKGTVFSAEKYRRRSKEVEERGS
jgi:hypothetical protein